MNRVLLSLFGAHVIGKVTFAVGDTEVGLLDAANQLIVEMVAFFGEVRGHAVGVRVLILEVGAYFRVVFLTKPMVLIGACNTMNGVGDGNLLRYRRRVGTDKHVRTVYQGDFDTVRSPLLLKSRCPPGN